MILQPIVERELRVGSRNKQNYIARTVIAASTTMMLGIFLFSMARAGMRGPGGREIFQGVSMAGAMWALIAGLGATCDCLSSEKRDGTLGLLFLTSLRSRDIVLGKLVVTSLSTVYALLACVPALTIPILMGGVSGLEIARSLLALANALFFALAAGMLCSALLRDGRKAIGWFVILGIFWTVPFQTLTQRGSPSDLIKWLVMFLTWLNPGHALSHAFAIVGKPGDLYWQANAFTLALGLLFLILANCFLPYTWRDEPKSKWLRNWSAFWESRDFGSPEMRLEIRRALLQPFPIQWLLCRRRWLPSTLLLQTLAFNGLGLAIAWRWCDRFDVVMPVLAGTMIGHLAGIKLKCAQEASNRWLEDRNSGALEMLLSTPLQIRELIRGQRRGLFRIFAGSVLATFLINSLFFGLILFVGSQGPNPPILPEKRIVVGLLVFIPTLMMVADLSVLSMVGIWSGVKARQAGQASAIAISRVLAWPWLVTWIVGFLIPLHVTRRNPSFTFVFVLWLLIGIAANIMAYCWAEVRLLTRLRVAATERYQPAEPGFWSRCQNWLAKRIRPE